MTFTVVCFAVCLLVLAVVVVATWPRPHVPVHNAPGRHEFFTVADRCALEGVPFPMLQHIPTPRSTQ